MRPGEGEAADHRVAGESVADNGPRAGDEVEDAGRQAGVDEALDQAKRRQRRGRRRLEDDGVAVDERRRHLPGGDGDGEVPGRDRSHHAERLAAAEQHRVRRVGRQDVAAEAASPRRRSSAGCPRARTTSPVASASVLPSSRVSVRATSSRRSVSRSAALNRMASRAGAGVAAHVGKASAAAAAAWAASATVALENTASTSSACAGFLVSKLAWSLAPTHSPPIRFLQLSMVHPDVAMPGLIWPQRYYGRRSSPPSRVRPGRRTPKAPFLEDQPGSGTSV